MDADTDRLFTGPDADAEDDLSLTCPACGADLVTDTSFIDDRVCGSCGRHFAMPARERVERLVDPGSFRDLRESLAIENLDNARISALDRIADRRERPILDEAIVTGTGAMGGSRVEIIALDDQYVSAQIGALGAEKILVALEHAHFRRLPVVVIVAGGASSVQAGPLAAVQGARIGSLAAQLRQAGVPMIAILTHPTSASVFSTVASHADMIFAEPGTHVGVAWSSSPSIDDVERAVDADGLLSQGWIDGIVERPALRAHLEALLGLLTRRGVKEELATTREPEATETGVGINLTRLLQPFVELRGDRVSGDDRHIVAGIGRLGDHVVAVAAQDPAVTSADSRTALRKLQRITQLAGRFELPLILVADSAHDAGPVRVTPGESLAAAAVADAIAMLPVSVVSVAAGRIQGVASGVMMTGDRRLMLDGAFWYLPVSAAARGGRVPTQAAGQYWSATECERLGLVDSIVEVPAAEAQRDPMLPGRLLRAELDYLLTELSRVGPRRLVEIRRRRHRMLGQETEAGIAAIRGELREWQDVQQSVAKSLEEWRERMGSRLAAQPRLSFQRPDLGDLAARLRARREELRQELLERAGRGERTGE